MFKNIYICERENTLFKHDLFIYKYTFFIIKNKIEFTIDFILKLVYNVFTLVKFVFGYPQLYLLLPQFFEDF